MAGLLRRGAVVALVLVVLGAWAVAALVHDDTCPEWSPSAGQIPIVGIGLLAAVGAGALSKRRRAETMALAAVAAIAVAGWSALLLARTRYLEPLPWSVGTLAVVVLVGACLGASLLSGFQWWTLLALPAASVGLFHVSPKPLRLRRRMRPLQRRRHLPSRPRSRGDRAGGGGDARSRSAVRSTARRRVAPRAGRLLCVGRAAPREEIDIGGVPP